MAQIDDVFEINILKHSRSFINNLSVLFKLTEIYEASNEALTKAAERFLGELKPLMLDSDDLTMKVAEESFFIEDIRVKAKASDMDNFISLAKTLDARGIGTLTFKATLSPQSLISILYGVKKSASLADAQAILEQGAESDIVIEGPVSAHAEEIDLKDTKLLARRSFVKAVSAIMEIHSSLAAGKNMNVKRAKRAVQSLVDCLLKDEPYVLGLASVRGGESRRPFVHPVDVALLSMAIGKRLGLGKNHLSRLGLAALFHDLGKAHAAPGGPEMAGGRVEDLERHPVEGARLFLRTRGLSDVTMLSMLVCFEHHMNLDMMGYPQPTRAWVPNIFSRIVRISNDYDAMASGDGGMRPDPGPGGVVEALRKNSGSAYDPSLLKVFLSVLRNP